MRSFISLSVLATIVLPIFTSVSQADTLIYNNSTTTGFFWPTNSDYNEEFLDYGSSSGGLVNKFEIAYATSLLNPGTLYIRFWRDTSRFQRGTPIKTITLTDLEGSPNGNTYAFYKEYTIPEEDRFQLPPGNFGYSYEFSWSYNESGPLLASGGSSNENYYWLYYINTWYEQQQIGGGYAGFYMKVYTGPALADITCDISGTKFNDTNGDGDWDGGEPGLPGWEMYIDENGDGSYQVSEPNVVTDPNGVYLFKNLEFEDPNDTKTFVVREIMKDGWTQTLPGGPDYEYSIFAEPNNIYVNYNFGNTDQPITKYGGGDGTPDNPYRIETAAHMNQIGTHQEDWGSHFILMDDINMSDITGEQYNIIGYRNSSEDYLYFTGSFDGNNHTIQNFSYLTLAEKSLVGLFGYSENASITDLTMTNVSISTAGNGVGGLAGFQKGGTINNCHVNASVEGVAMVGGLVGFSRDASIGDSSNSGSATGGDQAANVGGMIGAMIDTNVSNSFSTAVVSCGSECESIGGLIGYQTGGSTTDCYATGSVTTGPICENVGGLLGILQGTSTADRCYSSGTVEAGSGSQYVGGLIGYFFAGDLARSFSTSEVSASAVTGIGGLVGIQSGSVRHCYSRGSVTAPDQSTYVGGLSGYAGDQIYCCYSTGMVSAANPGDFVGGFAGFATNSFNSFWDTQTSGFAHSGGAKGRTTAQMQQAINYINWNTLTETNWVLDENNDYPHLVWEATAGGNLPMSAITDYLNGQGISAEPYQIADADDMSIIGLFPDQWDKAYQLIDDIEMPTSGNDYPVIGLPDMPFSGTFEGDGYAIRHFTYINPGSEYTVALFRSISGTVRNIVMEDVSISIGDGGGFAPLACGLTETGTVEHCYADGQIEVSGMGEYIGGLVAELEGTILYCDANVEIITGNEADSVGGLVGAVYSDGSIAYCSSMATIVTGNDCDAIGGLVGYTGGALTQNFSKGSVTAGDNSQRLGGLAGYQATNADMEDCYSKAGVSGGSTCQYVGGLVGRAYGDIFDCYSMGAVSAGVNSESVGGLVGVAASSSTSHDSYWDTETSGQPASFTGTPRTTEQMLTKSSYQTWDFTSVWRMCDGMNYPRLQWEPKLAGDFTCPDGVEVNDLMVLTDEWLAVITTADIAPDGGDGRVDLADWARLASAWMTSTGQAGWDADCDIAPDTPDGQINELDLSIFSGQWLYRGLDNADIAPYEAPDGRVDLLDFSLLAENWMTGLD